MEVVDGALTVMSCSDGDVLRDVRVLERNGDSIWSAVDLGDGLSVGVPVSLHDVARSGAFRVSGELRPLSEGDRVILGSDRDSRQIVVMAVPETFNDDTSC